MSKIPILQPNNSYTFRSYFEMAFGKSQLAIANSTNCSWVTVSVSVGGIFTAMDRCVLACVTVSSQTYAYLEAVHRF
ncbi:MAG: hypothetical protein V7K38_13125 [Nostoc sp.]|uniref:hypothetical protein n=1 Tax=Nostoc sp. TaxID=1180 RepID=UPI002FFAFA42